MQVHILLGDIIACCGLVHHAHCQVPQPDQGVLELVHGDANGDGGILEVVAIIVLIPDPRAHNVAARVADDLRGAVDGNIGVLDHQAHICILDDHPVGAFDHGQIPRWIGDLIRRGCGHGRQSRHTDSLILRASFFCQRFFRIGRRLHGRRTCGSRSCHEEVRRLGGRSRTSTGSEDQHCNEDKQHE